MNKAEAEDAIVVLVKQIDAIRVGARSDNDKHAAIVLIDKEIRELKKITGPRNITGAMHL